MSRVHSSTVAFNYIILNYLKRVAICPVLMPLFDHNLLFLVLGCINIMFINALQHYRIVNN